MNGTTERHVDDATIVRILDAELSAAHWRRHVERCNVCRPRAETLRGRSEAVRALLAAADGVWDNPPPDLWDRIQNAQPSHRGSGTRGVARPGRSLDPRRWHALAKAAAVAGILMAGGLAAEPVREWVRQTVAQLSGDARPSGAAVAPPAVSNGPVAVSARFIPETPALVIRIDEGQARGTLTVSFEAREDAQGRILTEDAGADLVVNPDGFRAMNVPEADWSYRFDVPERVEQVTVWVGGRPIRTLTPAEGRVHVLTLEARE